MNIPQSVGDVLRNHVTLEVEGIDRMYLNVYQPKLQTEKQAACFFRFQRGQPVASSSLMVLDDTPVTDLSRLKSLPLNNLRIMRTKVSSMAPLKGMPLKQLWLDLRPGWDAEVLRSLKGLKEINDQPAGEFGRRRRSRTKPTFSRLPAPAPEMRCVSYAPCVLATALDCAETPRSPS